ncbi:IS3 family transposase [Methylobacterium aquaticum]|uniref:IS3 family transposase n=1 Tax=Methylobacterium aquaticum TaxID=270351 RepID=UPI00315A422D
MPAHLSLGSWQPVRGGFPPTSRRHPPRAAPVAAKTTPRWTALILSLSKDFHTPEVELVHQRRWATRDKAQRGLFAYIEGCYDRQRLHSALGYVTPKQAERTAGQSPLSAKMGGRINCSVLRLDVSPRDGNTQSCPAGVVVAGAIQMDEGPGGTGSNRGLGPRRLRIGVSQSAGGIRPHS